jgi:hypothetical protein
MDNATKLLKILEGSDALGGFGFGDFEEPTAPIPPRTFTLLDTGSRFRIDGRGPTYEVRGVKGYNLGSMNARPVVQVGTAERKGFTLLSDDNEGSTVSLYLATGSGDPTGPVRASGKLVMV